MVAEVQVQRVGGTDDDAEQPHVLDVELDPTVVIAIPEVEKQAAKASKLWAERYSAKTDRR